MLTKKLSVIIFAVSLALLMSPSYAADSEAIDTYLKNKGKSYET